MGFHSPVKIALIIGTVIVFGIMQVFSYLGQHPAASSGLFNQTIGEVSRKYYTEITPSSWTFTIWAVFIYIWQAVWLLYGISTICKKTKDGYLYQTPSVMPPVIYLVFSFNCVSTVIWTVLWTREHLWPALLVIFLQTISLCISLAASFKELHNDLLVMYIEGLKRDVWFIRILVQNGLALFTTWSTIVTLVNFNIMITYDCDVPQDISSTVSLCILFGLIVTWFVLDIGVLDKYVRYTFTPYAGLMVGFTGIVAKNFNLNTAPRNSIFSAVLLTIICVAVVVKTILMVYRYIFQPIKPQPKYYEPTILA